MTKTVAVFEVHSEPGQVEAGISKKQGTSLLSCGLNTWVSLAGVLR